MSQMEQDAERIAAETFDLFRQILTKKYSTPEVAQIGGAIGDVSDPTLALYAASKLIDVTAARLGITGGARVMAQEKLVAKVRDYYESAQQQNTHTSGQRGPRTLAVAAVLVLIVPAIYWFGFRG